jgi:transposase
VIKIMDKHTIITLKLKGMSIRAIARQIKISRKTVARYWNEYQENLKKLKGTEDIRALQDQITAEPKYDSSTRKPVKYTTELDAALDEVLASEKEKLEKLGINNKLMLTCRQIHAELVKQGYDIGLTTVTKKVSEKRKRAKEAFIAQQYDLGDRLEYDFGEVKLEIAGAVSTYHMAVFGSPASKFRWAYLYRNQKKEVFLDSHVRFFEMVGGTWNEVVYDNMRNVVSRFIGKNEKELNLDLVKMSLYYGFKVNVTNCFSGNEKGFVESSVKALRREVFAPRYRFNSFEEAQEYLQERLATISTNSDIESEKGHLKSWRPPLEIARVIECIVDKYSFIRIDNNFYSVPDYLVDRKVIAKVYLSEIVIFSGLNKVCSHKKLEGTAQVFVDIFHYLDTLSRKPGALSHSVALRQSQKLKAIFDQHFSTSPRAFIECLKESAGKPLDEVVVAVQARALDNSLFTSNTPGGIAANVLAHSRLQLQAISSAFLKRGDQVAV